MVGSDCCLPRWQEQGWDWIPTQPPEGDACTRHSTQDEQPWVADWAIDGAGALASSNGLHSAVIMQLFTDKRLPDDRDSHITDPFERGGWWGDWFAPFEMGSYLWTLYRKALTDDCIQDVERYIREAIQPLLDQGAAARQQVTVRADKRLSQVYIGVALYARDGSRIYQQQFERFWG